MRIAVCADETYPVHEVIVAELEGRGHQVVYFGAFKSHTEVPWATATESAAIAVAEGRCDEGIFLCFTGTGASIAANKVGGVRAALCADAETAKGARIWNHANVLCLSHRLITTDLAHEILAAWFETEAGERGSEGVRALANVESRHLRTSVWTTTLDDNNTAT